MSNHAEILLCEDNFNDADLTIRALKEKNPSALIQWVKNGEEALDYLFARGSFKERIVKYKPKVILLDLKMPKIDGLDVLRKIRTHPDTKTIPVVILTSSNEKNDLNSSYEYGANSYIVKPVDFQKFSNSVSELGSYWLSLNQPGY